MKLIKSGIRNPIILALFSAALYNLAGCSSTSAPPPAVGAARIDYTKGVPGGVIVQTFKTTATVTAIDPAKRTATLRGSDGKKFAVTAGPATVNFDQVRVGDRINATVTQKIVASLDPADGTAGDGAAGGVARNSKGDQPGGRAAETPRVTAEVIAIDSVKRTATLRFEDGSLETLPIREDLDLSQRKVGERVVFRVTEMIALSVEKTGP
jgi:hypothetical protein